MAEARRRGDLVAFANDGGRDWDVARLIRLALDGKAGELVRAVLPRDTEPVFLKAHYSAFEGTPVAAALNGLGVTELALAGTATEMCVLVVRVLADGRDPAATPVRDAASSELVTISADQDLDEALRLLAEHQVRRLPVVEGDRLVGIVAQADVAREVSSRKTGDVVEDISR
jgi:CBS domain-containing protein